MYICINVYVYIYIYRHMYSNTYTHYRIIAYHNHSRGTYQSHALGALGPRNCYQRVPDDRHVLDPQKVHWFVENWINCKSRWTLQ